MYLRRLLGLFLLVAFSPLFSLGCSGKSSPGHSHAGEHHHAQSQSESTFGNPHEGYCPVMGDEVDVAKAESDPELYSDYEGKRYLFCCKECKPKFEKDPGKYIASPAAPNKEDAHSDHPHGDHDH